MQSKRKNSTYLALDVMSNSWEKNQVQSVAQYRMKEPEHIFAVDCDDKAVRGKNRMIRIGCLTFVCVCYYIILPCP
jgi:hypothetical protein